MTSEVRRLFGRDYLLTSSRAPWLPYALAATDLAGRALLGRTPPRPAPDLDGRTLVVAKIDHLGDLLMATPVLAALRKQRPTTRLVLIVGSWCEALARELARGGLVDAWHCYDAAPLNVGARTTQAWRRQQRSFRHTLAALRALDVAALVDLRPWSPNTLLLARLAGIPYRAGFALRGLGYTLHAEIPFDPDAPVGQNLLGVLPLLGLPAERYEGPVLAANTASVPSRSALAPRDPYTVVQFASRNAAREASLDSWRIVLRTLLASGPVVAVGTKADAERYGALVREFASTGLHDAMGQTTIGELSALVAHSRGGVTPDSFGAHVLLAHRRPVVVLMAEGLSQTRSYPAASPFVRFAPRAAQADAMRQTITTHVLAA